MANMSSTAVPTMAAPEVASDKSMKDLVGKYPDYSQPYVCMLCAQEDKLWCSKRSNDVLRHIKGTHFQQTPHSCHLCDYKAKNASALKTHLDGHNKIQRYTCGTCSKPFTDQSSRNRHEQKLHNAPARAPERRAKKIATRTARELALPTPGGNAADPIVVDEDVVSYPPGVIDPFFNLAAANFLPTPPMGVDDQVFGAADLSLFGQVQTGNIDPCLFPVDTTIPSPPDTVVDYQPAAADVPLFDQEHTGDVAPIPAAPDNTVIVNDQLIFTEAELTMPPLEENPGGLFSYPGDMNFDFSADMIAGFDFTMFPEWKQ